MSDYDRTPNEQVDILLVEDNPGDVRLIEEAFKTIDTRTDFHVLHDGTEIAQHLDPHQEGIVPTQPDLILLDLNLPKITGFEVLEILNQELDYPPPPVLILSSSDTEEDIERGYENDVNAYLTKPDDMAQLSSMAQAIEDFWFETAQQPPAPS